MSRLCLAIAVTLAALTSAQAQHAPASPFAEWEHRAVKALSDQQIVDLRADRGMGLAMPAELNGYPGPVHVLELGDHRFGDYRHEIFQTVTPEAPERRSVPGYLLASSTNNIVS
jgi:hypothetical protein